MTVSEGLFARLAKTRKNLTDGLLGVFKTAPQLDDSLFDEIEDHLIMADLGVKTSQKILELLRASYAKNKIDSADLLLQELKQIMVGILDSNDHQQPETLAKPHVILMVGVNGVGKTTTLAKLARLYKQQNKQVIMAAGDTFRAAAIEQLQSWGDRLDIPVIAQSHGSDAAAVAFDAYSAATARSADILLIDSAGRQHTHTDLMEQLKKIKRVLAKVDEHAPHEVLITVDAGNGQNALSQIENFQNTIPLTGLCVTKLDGTARGGVVIALSDQFDIPIKYIGVGEGVDQLRPFDAVSFVDALLPDLANND